jgi:hypothetical protein
VTVTFTDAGGHVPTVGERFWVHGQPYDCVHLKEVDNPMTRPENSEGFVMEFIVPESDEEVEAEP